MSYSLLSSLLLSSMISTSTLGAVNTIPNSGLNFSLFKNKNSGIQPQKTTTKMSEENIQYRLYIDSSGDVLNNKKGAIDFNYGRVDRNQWYAVALPLMTFKYADFGVKNKNHQDLVDALGKQLTLKYQYAFNMWDSKWGWRYDNGASEKPFAQGKEVALKDAEQTVILRPYDYLEAIQREKASTGTEQGRVELKQIWNDVQESFSIVAIIGVWYTWKDLTPYFHASLTKFSYKGLGDLRSLKLGSESGLISETLQLSKQYNEIKLDNVFDKARELYDKKRADGWQELIPVITTYSASAFAVVPEGTIFAWILLLNNFYMLNDINFVMTNKYESSGSLKFVTYWGAGLITDMYYNDILGISHFMSSASLPITDRNVDLNFFGGWTLAYLYSVVTDGFKN